MRTDGEMNEQARKEKRACYRMTTRDWNCPSGKRYDSTFTFEGNCRRGREFPILFRWNKAYSETNNRKIEENRDTFSDQSQIEQSIILNETIRRFDTINENVCFFFFFFFKRNEE